MGERKKEKKERKEFGDVHALGRLVMKCAVVGICAGGDVSRLRSPPSGFVSCARGRTTPPCHNYNVWMDGHDTGVRSLGVRDRDGDSRCLSRTALCFFSVLCWDFLYCILLLLLLRGGGWNPCLHGEGIF